MEKKKYELFFFGILTSGEHQNVIQKEALPVKSKDPFVSYGILPANPLSLKRRYAIKGYVMDVFAWLLLLLGIALNIVFIFLILSLLTVI